MTTINLDPYLVRVRKRRDRKGRQLGKFDGKTSLSSVVDKTLKGIKNKNSHKLELLSKAVTIDELENNGSHIRGTIKSGLYGFAGSIIDSDSGTENYKKKKTDADLVPMFFDFYLPDDAYKGLLVIQTFGTFGIRQVIEHTIVDFFRDAYEDYMLDIKPVVPAGAAQEFLKKCQVNKVQFIKHGIPSDFADKFKDGAGDREGEIEISFKPKDKGLFAKVDAFVDFFEGNTHLADIYEFDDFEYDNIKMELEYEGRKRSLDFSNPSRLKASIDITKTIKRGIDGYPEYAAVKEESEKIVNHFAKSMGLASKAN